MINNETQPLVSVVIPTKNRQDSLERLLASIYEQECTNIEILIIDDGSETPVSITHPNVTIFRNEYSLGASSARNYGFKIAKGKYCLFFDDDAELIETDSIKKALAIAEKYPKSGAIGFKQLTHDGQDSYMQPTSADQICYTAYFFSYACIVSKAAFEKIGGFNESFGYYYEEVEFCLRLHNAGYEIIYDPNLRVKHYHDLEGRNWNKIYRFTMRNAILTVITYYPLWLVFPASLRFIMKHLQITKLSGVDWGGILWLVQELSKRRIVLLQNRTPLSFNTLREFKRLKTTPIALSMTLDN